jgi:hypothetical protein
MAFNFEIETEVGSSAARVWAGVTRMAGVNAELLPYVRMTCPAEFADRGIDEAPLGEVAFRSWLLAFGVLPFDLHALKLEEVGDGWFVEVSSSWMQRVWRHERHVAARTPLAEPLGRAVVAFLFRHRHRQLQRLYGA